MGAKKGSNHFKSFQQARVQKKLEEIDKFLDSLPEKATFERFEDLVAECCKHLGCHRTTITRQQAYVDRLRKDFQLRNPDLMSVSAEHSSPTQIDQSIKARDSQIASLQGSLERYKKDLHEANAKLKYYESKEFPNFTVIDGVPELPDTKSQTEADSSNDKKNFEYTAHALSKLLKYLEDNKFGIVLKGEANKSKVSITDEKFGGLSTDVVESKYLRPMLEYLDKSGKKHE